METVWFSDALPGASLPLRTHLLVNQQRNPAPSDTARPCARVAEALWALTSLGLSGLLRVCPRWASDLTGSCLALWALTSRGLFFLLRLRPYWVSTSPLGSVRGSYSARVPRSSLVEVHSEFVRHIVEDEVDGQEERQDDRRGDRQQREESGEVEENQAHNMSA